MKIMRTFTRAAKGAFSLLILSGCAVASAQEVIPDFYKEPGLATYRELTDQHYSESIDPFTGSLQQRYVDFHLPGSGGFNLDVVRSYNSATVIEANPDAYIGQAGVGWTMHFGRVLSKFAPLPCTSPGFGPTVVNNPVVELPDGTRQVLNLVGTPIMMSTNFWKAECETNGIGLIVYSPEGLRYDMTQQVNVSVGTSSQIAWYTTKITDRNGNFATIAYAGTTAQISTVTASDGRKLTYAYGANGLIHTISTNGVGASTFTYNYTAIAGSTTSYQLTSVVRPDNTSWKYQYNASLGSTAGSYIMSQVTYPESGTLAYSYGYVYFDTTSNPASRSTVVKTKNSSDLGAWTFNYAPGLFGVYDTTTVTGPEGTITYKHIGPNYATLGSVWQVGLLMSKTYGTVQSEAYTYGKIKISNQTNMRPGAFSVRTDPEVDVPVLTSSTIVRDGATYSTIVNSYDSWGHPTKTTETGPGSGSRITSLSYNVDMTLWVINDWATDVVTGGLSVGRTFDSHDNVLTEVRDGIQTSHVYFPTGDVQQTTFPRSLVHNYSNYKLGVAESESQPENVTLARVVDDVGRLTSFTDGEKHTTGYGYDGLGRITSVAYPTGNPLGVVYTATTKSATRGSLSEVTTVDGFGRPVSVVLGGIPNTYKYDAAGRITFASNPGAAIGTTFSSYDVLGRYQLVTNADGTTRKISYGSGSMTAINERKKSTTYSYRAYGHPEEHFVMSVVAAEPTANISIARDSWDRVTSVTQGGFSRTYAYYANGYLKSIISPEVGSTFYGRDDAGNMTSQQIGSPLGGESYVYDGQNRLASIAYLGTSPQHTISRTYYRNGRVNSVTNTYIWPSTINYVYDANDNLLTESVAVGGNTFTTARSYTGNDQISSITYPRTGTVVNYLPDTLGRPTAVSGFVSSVTYWPSGQINTISYANGTTSSYGQNSRLWPSGFNTSKAATVYTNATYLYDGVGNLNSIADSADSSYNRTLGYDNIDRLTTATGPWGAGTIAYDGVGNIKSQNLGTYGLSYSYDANNRLATLSGSAASSYTYDGLGNITSAYGNTYLYDSVPNLVCVNCGNTNNVGYGYDGNNRRLVVSRDTAATSYEIYDASDKLLLTYSLATGATTEYFYLGGKRIAQRVSSGPALTQTVIAAQPQATVGTHFNLSADVTGAIVPVAKVNFYEGSTLLGSSAVDPTTGFATLSVSTSALAAPTVGTHSFTATYVGDSQTATSSSTSPANISIVSSAFIDTRPFISDDGYPFVATMNVGGNAPTGQVTFFANGVSVGTAPVNSATATATYSGTIHATGNYAITASYPGDGINPASTPSASGIALGAGLASVSLMVNPSQTAVAINQPIRVSITIVPSNHINMLHRPLPQSYSVYPVYPVYIKDGNQILGTGIYDDILGISVVNFKLTTAGTHDLAVIFEGSGPYPAVVKDLTIVAAP